MNSRQLFQNSSPLLVSRAYQLNVKYDGNVLNWVSIAMKLTRGRLLKQEEWSVWQHSERLQMDQYNTQGMFGVPCRVNKENAIFNLVWMYNVKELDNKKKA